MRGFALIGPGTSGTETGILLNGAPQEHVQIRNGIIREWGGPGLSDVSIGGVFDHLSFDHDGTNAAAPDAVLADNAALSDCDVAESGNGTTTAVVLHGGSLARCNIAYSIGVGLAANDAAISDTTVSNGNTDGIHCWSCSIINSTVNLNTGVGINATRTTIGSSTVYNNTGDNVMLQDDSTIHDSSVTFSTIANGVEVTGTSNIVARNQIGVNHLDGVLLDCCAGSGDTVEDNTVSYNQGYGVHVFKTEGAATIARNHLVGNTGIAIFLDVGGAALPDDQATEVEGNDIDANGAMHGIEVDTGKNLIIQNRETGSSASGILAAGCGGCSANTIGPVETGVSGLSNPWANIVFPN